MPARKPFSATFFYHHATLDNIQQALNYLMKDREINRLSRGVYTKPDKERFKLTNQYLQQRLLNPKPNPLYNNKNSRKLKIGKRIVTLKHIKLGNLIWNS